MSYHRMTCKCCGVCDLIGRCGSDWTVAGSGFGFCTGVCVNAGGGPPPSSFRNAGVAAPNGTWVTDQYAEGVGFCSWYRDVDPGLGPTAHYTVGVNVYDYNPSGGAAPPAGSVYVSAVIGVILFNEQWVGSAVCGGGTYSSSYTGFTNTLAAQLATIADICAGVPLTWTGIYPAVCPTPGGLVSGGGWKDGSITINLN